MCRERSSGCQILIKDKELDFARLALSFTCVKQTTKGLKQLNTNTQKSRYVLAFREPAHFLCYVQSADKVLDIPISLCCFLHFAILFYFTLFLNPQIRVNYVETCIL